VNLLLPFDFFRSYGVVQQIAYLHFHINPNHDNAKYSNPKYFLTSTYLFCGLGFKFLYIFASLLRSYAAVKSYRLGTTMSSCKQARISALWCMLIMKLSVAWVALLPALPGTTPTGTLLNLFQVMY
jgi:hypothetical protein